MPLPSVAPAPLVTAHADVFRDLFEHRRQFHHLQNDLTGLIVLDHKSLANITRCVLERADTTNRSRCCSEAPWFQEQVNDRRLTSLLQQTKAIRGPKADAILMLDDTWCEPVGSLFDSVDRPDNHGDDPSPRAHHPVPSPDGSGPGRLPVDLRLSRRSEARTRGEAFVHTHVPDRPIPTQQKARARLQKTVAPVWREAPDFQQLHQQVRTQIALGMAFLAAAMQPKVPWNVRRFDRWSLAEAWVSLARYRTQDWRSVLKQHRHGATQSFVLKATAGKPLQLEGPHLAVEALVPRLPPTASREVTVGDTTSWTLTLAVRLPGLGNVRLVVRVKNVEWTGPYAVWVTNRVDGSAQRLLTLSLQRWPIATFSQDGTGQLGVDT